jgi:hypothetical protein
VEAPTGYSRGPQVSFCGCFVVVVLFIFVVLYVFVCRHCDRALVFRFCCVISLTPFYLVLSESFSLFDYQISYLKKKIVLHLL